MAQSSQTRPIVNIPPASGRRSNRPIAFLIFLLALTAAFGTHLVSLFKTSLESDLNSYIVLIPLVSIYFLYLNRERLSRTYEGSFGWALLPLLAGCAALAFLILPLNSVRVLSENNRLSCITFAFVSFLWSGTLMILGRDWTASAAFPIFFLLFLVPLPDPAVEWMETGLRVASAEAANLFFSVSGTPAMQSGTVFQLPGITLEVAKECSGIKSTWVLLITSIIAGQLFLVRPWSRLALLAAVIPLGILRNGFRIMVIGLLCVHVGPHMIHSIIHRRGGPLFFALSLIPLVVVLWVFRKTEVDRIGRTPAKITDITPTG